MLNTFFNMNYSDVQYSMISLYASILGNWTNE